VALIAACGPGRVVRRGHLNEDALAEVRTRLPAVRGLSFASHVPAAALSPEEVSAIVSRDLDLSYAPGDVERIEAAYARLGLLPPDTALRPALQRLYEREGAGFYDPRQKRLVIATRALAAGGFRAALFTALTGRDVVGEFLVAHELTHALQDQRWGLPTEPESLVDGGGDRRLARHALIEGDATLAGFAYVLRRPLERHTIAWIVSQMQTVPAELAKSYPEAPELLRASLSFLYASGSAFAGEALRRGDFATIDRVHDDPPASSEQVLHPERYYTRRDQPVIVTIGGTERLERAGWKRTLDDTVGELGVRVLGAGKLPPERAESVAEGWGGDRLRVLARGDDLVLVWMTAWDTLDDAAQFATALPTLTDGALIERRDDRVLALLGPPDDGPDLGYLAAATWKQTGFARLPLAAQ
jgi:hypothetical protein